MRADDDPDLAWRHLSADGINKGGWQTISLSGDPSIQLRAGCRAEDRAQALLAGFPGIEIARASIPKESEGFLVEHVSMPGSDSSWLAVTRKMDSDFDLFRSVAADLVAIVKENAAAPPRELLALFVGRIRAWQEFMKKSKATLSAEEELGLVGELVFLTEVLEFGVAPSEAVRAWNGPLSGLQDFVFGSGAVEIKATLSTAGFPARVASLDQLDDALVQPLFVAAVRLHSGGMGRTLAQWIESVAALVAGDAEAVRLFHDRIRFAGYDAEHASFYERCLSMVNTSLIEVGAGFPRLTPGTVPMGVRNATYEIELDQIAGPRPPLSAVLKQLGVI